MLRYSIIALVLFTQEEWHDLEKLVLGAGWYYHSVDFSSYEAIYDYSSSLWDEA
ncbi:MAG: hypothetical protein UZ21_OP11001000688 [Microgenomates bacterium OLB22]|nr:MAG: hypothetical protein UZ21_OP11001000688 [Microgenomates bacterium OLB22]